MLTPKNKQVFVLLEQLQQQLRGLNLWQNLPPAPEALESEQPFCIDTLTLPQWLQFIFIPKLRYMIEHQIPLPKKSGVASICEEFFRGKESQGVDLVATLVEIDNVLKNEHA